jgi:TonB-dependent receptor
MHYSSLRRALAAAVIGVVLACGPGIRLSAQPGTGIVAGRVVDAASSDPLPGAIVGIKDTTLETVTDRDGRYRLTGAPAGAQVLVIRFLGRRDQLAEVVVTAGATLETPIAFDQPYAYNETVSVTSELMLDAQARALNQQKNALDIRNVVSADLIGSFPDPNAAETTQRIPGITITKDQGEGRYVSVRGTEPRLNSMMLDGERIPAPDPLLRQVALDVVPSELLQAIEVSKALTPDMDADSIGGSVNLVTKQAPQKFRLLGRIGTGYNQLLDSYNQPSYSFTAGQRFGGVGAIFSIAGAETNRANNDVEVSYTPTLGIADFDPRYYEVIRRRVGATGAVDFKGAGSSLYTVRGVFNRFIDDHERRNRLRERVTNRRIERERRDRTHIERIASLSFDGRSLLFGRSTFDFKVLGAYSDQTDPLTMTTTFRQSNVNFAPNVSADSIDPDNIQANPLNQDINAFTFNNQIRATNYSKDQDIVGSANLRMPLRQGATSLSFLKVGLKFRNKLKGRDRNEDTITTSATLRLTDFVLADAHPRPYLDGRYDLLPFMDQAAVAKIPDLVATTAVKNHTRDAEEFDGTERTTAGYVMAEFYPNARTVIVPGLRYEYTSADFTGRDVRFAPNGTWLDTVPLRSTQTYGVPLPSIQARFAMTPNSNIRAAVTRSIARPNYYDTVPYRAQDDAAATVSIGNHDLRPTSSWNVDLMGEHYFKSVGVVSAGVFYKRLEDYIYVFTFDDTINNSIYHVTQPQNGDVATVRGVELALQNQLTFLPPALRGIGVYANYTFTDSSAAIPGHEGSRLPGQSRHVGNLAASYERFGFSGRVSVNFHGSYVDQIGATNLLDRFYDQAKQADVSLSQKVTRNLRVYLDALNLNGALLRYYQGVPNRPLQEEHYNWWLNFGVKVDF